MCVWNACVCIFMQACEREKLPSCIFSELTSFKSVDLRDISAAPVMSRAVQTNIQIRPLPKAIPLTRSNLLNWMFAMNSLGPVRVLWKEDQIAEKLVKVLHCSWAELEFERLFVEFSKLIYITMSFLIGSSINFSCLPSSPLQWISL